MGAHVEPPVVRTFDPSTPLVAVGSDGQYSCFQHSWVDTLLDNNKPLLHKLGKEGGGGGKRRERGVVEGRGEGGGGGEGVAVDVEVRRRVMELCHPHTLDPGKTKTTMMR